MSNELVLVVDDHPHNLQMMGQILMEKSYHPAFAQNGADALDFVTKRQPDLILLDIMMPDIDGFEVCKQLKQNSITADIPVIFLTAKTETHEVIEGLELGAVDYVTKPFNVKELMTRVNTHLELFRLRKELKQTVEELKQANATKDRFFTIITYDLKNLFHALLGLSELLEDKALEVERKEHLIKSLQQSSTKGYNLLKNLLEWSNSQTGKMACEPVKLNLKTLVTGYVNLLASAASAKKITLSLDIDETTFVFADESMLHTIFRNILSNALKFTPTNGKVAIFSKEKDKFVEISISDTGIGIRTQDIPKLFRTDIDHNIIGTGGEIGTGLGLILCKEFVERNGGKILVESEEGKGILFHITIPSQ